MVCHRDSDVTAYHYSLSLTVGRRGDYYDDIPAASVYRYSRSRDTQITSSKSQTHRIKIRRNPVTNDNEEFSAVRVHFNRRSRKRHDRSITPRPKYRIIFPLPSSAAVAYEDDRNMSLSRTECHCRACRVHPSWRP